MEKLYRKKANGRYEHAGYGDVPDLCDGIWLVQNRTNVRSKSSLVWKVGDLKRPVDVVTKSAFYSIMDEVAQYIVKLSDPNSIEYLEAVEHMGDWDGSGNRGYGVYNIAAIDYAMLILNKISEYFEETEDPPSLYQITIDFIKENPGFWEYRDKLENYLIENDYVIKKKHG